MIHVSAASAGWHGTVDTYISLTILTLKMYQLVCPPQFSHPSNGRSVYPNITVQYASFCFHFHLACYRTSPPSFIRSSLRGCSPHCATRLKFKVESFRPKDFKLS